MIELYVYSTKNLSKNSDVLELVGRVTCGINRVRFVQEV